MGTTAGRSPLAPLTMNEPVPVAGMRLATLATGLRYKGRDDLLLMALDEGTTVGGVFTRSTTAGHPVLWDRRILPGGRARAVIVNAGNANVFRGPEGDAAVLMEAETVASALGCTREEVFVASTGVIGDRLPVEGLCARVPDLVASLAADGLDRAAAAIMTTDTFPKWSTASTEIDGRPVTIAGIAKGSGMIAPNMATMLSFIVTDAALPAGIVQDLVARGADRSFNAITVDSDTSTSDTVLLLATGKAGNAPPATADDASLSAFREALETLMRDLALMVVRDGEGAQKLITINVKGAADDSAARRTGLAIGNSPLVKTAIAGEDANWGRVIMAIGKSGEAIENERIAIAFGGHPVAVDGGGLVDLDEAPIDAHLAGREIVIDVVVGGGTGSATVWTCDLTHGYIEINADYRS
ncbi:MAG: bifunctional glutamate N-acetyltransferase/amino-acid acetyltransferase ArgJ [Geminicoccaceae bacterium]|nr:bifunctional glutamate N-acetyltransferase/amino-acid acetyltransferase ArgJ [Geminicoccaceae bacterium]